MIAIPMIVMKGCRPLDVERRDPIRSSLKERPALEVERFPWPHRGRFIRPRCAQRGEHAERRAPHPRSDVERRILE
jgi:hypothetical protein